MKSLIGSFIGLVLSVGIGAEPLLEGRVRLESGEPVADAQVRLFDMTDLRQGAIARAMTDGTGYFALPLAALTDSALPEGFALGPNYPNPFNPSTIIPYQLAASSEVRLEVFNLLGQHIVTLVDGERPAGFHTATWHATDAAGRAVGAGVYIYRMTVGAASQTGRMVLVDGQAGVAAGGSASVWSSVSGGGGSDGEDAQVYGLIVSGSGLVPYVDSAFRVEAGMTPVELVVSEGQHPAGKATDDDLSDLFGAFNEQQEEEEDQAEEEEEDAPEEEEGEEDDETPEEERADGQELIPDANLRAAIAAALGKASGAPITQADMAMLDTLDGPHTADRGISDLTGLEYAINLRFLYLSFNNISDISPLANLPQLDHLYLNQNKIVDISPLAGLTKLIHVDIRRNRIRDLAPLAGLTNLRLVQVDRNPLNAASRDKHIPALQAKNVEVRFDLSVDVDVGGTDLQMIIQSLSVSNSTLTAGQSFTLETTVHNQGTNTVESWLYYFRSTDATIDETDAQIYTNSGAVEDLKPSATQTVSLDWIAPPYAGTYYYGVCDSYRNFTNCSSGVRVTVEGSKGGTPDLTVHPLSVSHPIITPGGTTSIEMVVENIGSGPAAATTARLYRSDDATIDANDKTITRWPSKYLGVGNKWIWTNHTQISPRIPAGTYYYGLCIDPTIGETNTGNNCSTSVPVTVKAGSGSPDLIVVTPGILDHRPETGDFRLWAIVRNIGTDLSDHTTLRYYRSDDATIDATDAQLTTRSFGSLAVEGYYGDGPDKALVDFNNWSTIVTASTSPGTYYYGACVDPVPGESDTNNNCSEAVPMNVGVPDLAVGLAWVSMSVPLAGQSFTLTATVRNQGPDQATSTTLRYYRSDDATIDAADTPVGTDAVSSLTAFDGSVSGPGSRLVSSGTSRQAISVSAPSRPGTYYYGACADAVPNETNTDNNCSAGTYVRVVPSGEDPFNIELVFVDDFTDAHKDVMRQAARHWETIISEGLPDVNFSANPLVFFDADGRVAKEIDDTVDDLRIFVFKVADLGGAVGTGGPDYVRSGNLTGLPALGRIAINASFLARMQQWEPLWQEQRLLRDLMLHEIAHVLGFGTGWTHFDLLHDDLDPNFGGDPYFSGKRAIEAFNAAGGESYSGNKVPVEFGHPEHGGHYGCGSPAHWRAHVFQGFARDFGSEIMEPLMVRRQALSAITIQSLADLGYVVDVSRADPYRLPASVSTAGSPTASAKPVASHDLDLGFLRPIYVGDEQGRIIRTIGD